MPNQSTGQEISGVSEVKPEAVTPIKSTETGVQSGIRTIKRDAKVSNRGTEHDQLGGLKQSADSLSGDRRRSSIPYRITGNSQQPVTHL